MFMAPIYSLVKLFFLQLYPAYMCYKAINLKDASQYSTLIMYWITITCYLLIEYVTDIFIFWFPFYYEIKLLIALWLILPQTNGTSIIYHQYLEPFLKQNEPLIDQTLIDIQKNVKQYINIYWKKGIEFLRTAISDSLFRSSEEDTTTTNSVQPNDDNVTNNNNSSQSLTTTWNPYNLFYTLMLKTSTADHVKPSQPLQQKQESSSSSSTSEESSSVDKSLLERTDSYDSLASFTSNKKQSQQKNDSIESTSSNNDTWGSYMASFIWKSPSSAPAIDKDKETKQD
ncbi:unnamed protein product [Cunninghamella blakesleeana]